MRNTYLKTKDLSGNDVYINPLAVSRVHCGPVHNGSEEGACAVMFYGRERELWIKEDHTEVAKLCRKVCEKSPITWGVETTPTGKNVAVFRRAPGQFSPSPYRVEFTHGKRDTLLEQSILFICQEANKDSGLSRITSTEREGILTSTPISELISGAEIVQVSQKPFIQVVINQELLFTRAEAFLDLLNMNISQEDATIKIRTDQGPLKKGDFAVFCYGVSLDLYKKLIGDIYSHPKTKALVGAVKVYTLAGDLEIAAYP